MNPSTLTSHQAVPEFLSFLYDGSRAVPSWLWTALALHDPTRDLRLRPFYDFLRHEAVSVPGDIAEFGVFRADATITIALQLIRMGIDRRVYGFDSFTGFPEYAPQDDPSVFDYLRAEGRITQEHFEWVKLLRSAENLRLYRQHRFTDTNLQLVRQRIASYRLDNVVLHPGQFADTIAALPPTVRFCAVLMDCDLYESYRLALPACWERLSPGGFVYLDEYFSLKYPGPRIAVDDFCARYDITPQRVLGYSADDQFERWFIRKPLER
jgi:hypothetical protein